MALGGTGVISVASNLIPERVVALVKSCKNGDFTDARKRYYELLPFCKAIFLETNPAPIKRAMVLAGLPAGPARLPVGPVTEATDTALRAELTRLRI
jgi:4-hydroxy-tetrahydrodipicolinate synthase